MKKFAREHSYILLLVGILAALIIVLSVASPFFLTWKNIRNILNQSSIYLILAVGMTFVISMGEIDLSVGAIIGFSGMIMGMLNSAGQPALLSMAIGLAVAAGRACQRSAGVIRKDQLIHRDIGYDDDTQRCDISMDEFKAVLRILESVHFHRLRKDRPSECPYSSVSDHCGSRSADPAQIAPRKLLPFLRHQ